MFLALFVKNGIFDLFDLEIDLEYDLEALK